jgi:hypothetical protein
MKKGVLLASLALVLVLTLTLPVAALAWDMPKPGPAVTDFTGSGTLFVTYFPDPVMNGKIWRYNNEVVEGYIESSTWDALQYAYFSSTHDSVVRVADNYDIQGTMWGTFTMTNPDGVSVLRGIFQGRITGNIYSGEIHDIGTWTGISGTGVFAGVKAWGQWSADLLPGLIPGTDIPSLVGQMNWEGKYSGGKPVIKPWKTMPSFKPGKPIRPWKPAKP